MWKLLDIAGRLIERAFTRREPVRLSDEQLRTIAREHIGDGNRPFSVVLSECRERVQLTGAALDDNLDARLVNAIDNELCAIRLPAELAKLEQKMRDVVDAFEPKTPAKK